MLRTGQLLAPRTGTLLLRFDKRDLSRRREPRYRGPWCLPGPDLHRLADDSLSLGYTIWHSFSSGTRAAGCTITAVKLTTPQCRVQYPPTHTAPPVPAELPPPRTPAPPAPAATSYTWFTEYLQRVSGRLRPPGRRAPGSPPGAPRAERPSGAAPQPRPQHRPTGRAARPAPSGSPTAARSCRPQ